MNNARFTTVDMSDKEEVFNDDLEKLSAEHEILTKILSNKEFMKYQTMFIIPRINELLALLSEETDAKKMYRLQGSIAELRRTSIKSIELRRDFIKSSIDNKK